MSFKVKFSQLETLSSSLVKPSAIFPVVQDGENYQIPLSSIPSSGGSGGDYDDSALQAASGNWNSTYTTVGSNSASWIGGGIPIQQNLGVVAGSVLIDVTDGESAIARLSGDTTLSITGANEGESGMLVLGHDDAGDTWTVSVSAPDSNDHHVMTGDLANFAEDDNSGYNIGTVGWYNDGSDYYMYVSNIIKAADPLNLNN